MGSSDLLLLPSDHESFGLVALEAMACEVPVVVSRVGGLPELVTEGVDGFLVEPRKFWVRWRVSRSSCYGMKPGARKWASAPVRPL